ncbi:hypothetical protein T265_02139 [Opisthorchis viverrini]|uniref:Uncharacterized protein n=1 Tax=Opisthorchis viverrini TaxID=6198 RepID=A0A074ZWZ0_OPIVI|nr:hypothetical protein T265_02139 [Opisthorchis viverrini]KER31626.1 hypothetical protein T265_02139 [Opisthorchis viverrini]
MKFWTLSSEAAKNAKEREVPSWVIVEPSKWRNRNHNGFKTNLMKRNKLQKYVGCKKGTNQARTGISGKKRANRATGAAQRSTSKVGHQRESTEHKSKSLREKSDGGTPRQGNMNLDLIRFGVEWK